MAFTFDVGDFAFGSIGIKLLILSSVGLMVGWSIHPVGENVVAEGLKFKLAFPSGVEDSITLVCLIQDSDWTDSAGHTLATY